MGLTLGIFIGESFAELSLVDSQTQQQLDFQRWYLPRASLKSFLNKYLAEKSITALDKAFVSHRFLEKLFSYRLGGSVAQVVTSGFEKVLNFEENSNTHSFLWSQKPPPISSNEMIFSIQEKTNAHGAIEKPIDPSALEQITSKLKMMEIKRVCVHFHNSCLNDQNQTNAKNIFESAGFDVFIPDKVSSELEFHAWRKNLIEAAITGTFLEMQEDLQSALSSVISAENIYFLDSDLSWFRTEKNKRLSSLCALENLWIKSFPKILKSNEPFDIFHFGLENFSLIQSEIQQQELPWGKIPIKSHKRKDFQLQPTQSLKLNDNNELVIDKKELSFEPGPITMGRGVIPCVYDLLNYSESLSKELQEKLKRSLQAMLKNSQKSTSITEALNSLKKNILDQLASHIEFSRSKKSKQVLVYGLIADFLEQDLKNHPYFSKLNQVSEKNFPKSFLIANWGLSETK